MAGILLLAWELRTPNPFIDIRLLGSNRALTRTYVRGGATALGTYTVLYGLSAYLEAGRGFSPNRAGLLIVPLGAAAAVVARPLARRNLIRGPLLIGAITGLLGTGGLALLVAGAPLVVVVITTLLFGITLGATTTGNQAAMYAQAAASQVGTAAGLFRTVTYVGSIASSVVTGIAFRHRVGAGQLNTVVEILAATGVAMLLLTVFDRALRSDDRSRRRRGRTDPRDDVRTAALRRI